MTPTLLNSDVVLVRFPAGQIRRGDIVLARFRSAPELIVIKRAVQPEDGGWLLSSDNARAGVDWQSFGVADVLGKTSWAWRNNPVHARRAITRWIPQRLGSHPPVG